MSILDDLKNGIVLVEFEKRDGTVTSRYYTQCTEIFESLNIEDKSRDVIKRASGSYSTVYDLANGWRNLSHSSVIAWQFATPEQAYAGIEGAR